MTLNPFRINYPFVTYSGKLCCALGCLYDNGAVTGEFGHRPGSRVHKKGIRRIEFQTRISKNYIKI